MAVKRVCQQTILRKLHEATDDREDLREASASSPVSKKGISEGHLIDVLEASEMLEIGWDEV